MIATCFTKYNGKWYRAGEVLPDTPSIPKETPKVETPKESVEVEKPRYNKKDISFMKLDNLKKLAAELGIEGDHGTKELKQLVIEKLGL